MNPTAAVVDLERQYTLLLAEYPELAEDDQLRADMLEGSTDLHEVLSRLVEGVAEANMMREAIKARRVELAEREDRFAHRAEVYRSLIERVMTATDTVKVVLPIATLSVRDAAPKLVEVNLADTPEHLWRVKREPNKAAISDTLKQGVEVPGWTLSNGGKSLTIRSK